MHIIETGAGRRYKVRWREGGRNRARHFEKRQDARDFDAVMRRQRQTGQPVLAATETLADYAEGWLKAKAREVTPQTASMYALQLDKRIGPMLGGYRMGELAPAHVREFIARMRKDGANPPTITKACTVLQSILARAVEDGLLERNVAQQVKKPSARRTREPVFVTPAQVEAIRAQLEPRDGTLVSVLAYAGLRPESEALPLVWRQVGERSLNVLASKTGKGRQVRLLAPLAEDLAAWRKLTRGTLVFPYGRGGWSRDDWRNWTRRVFRPAAVEAGLPADVRPRDLRGSFASLLIWSGMNVLEVAQQLGHSPSMCLDTYAGVLAEYDPAKRRPAEDMIREARS